MSRGRTGASHNQAAIDKLTPMIGNDDDAFAWQRAHDDALRALRSIPDPALFAASIEERHREALRRAWQSQNGWRVHPEDVRELRILGLVEVSGLPGRPEANPESRNHLGAFGMAVRRVVMEAI